jgi:hypothetical protein
MNKPLMGMAIALIVVGFFLCLTIALMPLGLVLMGAGGAWAAVLYYTSRHNARLAHWREW